MNWGDGWHSHYPPTVPRPKAATGKERKKFGLTWWGRRWVRAVEEKGDDARMSRGRAYARAERVFNVKIKPGGMSANVEGSMGDYRVSLSFRKHPPGKWSVALAKIRGSHALAALMNNELAEDTEKMCGLELVPSLTRSSCNCPDWANPCKHIAAVYYVLADEIDAAPQILFHLAGLEREALLAGLQGDGMQPDGVMQKKATTAARGVAHKKKAALKKAARSAKRGKPKKASRLAARQRKGKKK